METIATKVKALRLEKEMNRHEFAKACNLPRTTLINIESGKTRNPCTMQICKIAKALKKTPNDIIPDRYYK